MGIKAKVLLSPKLSARVKGCYYGNPPEKGVDYWTDEDKKEIEAELAAGTSVVSTSKQSLSDEQKNQARENIGAASEVDTVQTVPQALTEKQQAQARENINAVSEEKLTALQEDVTGLEQAQIDLDGKLAELQQSQSETDSKLTEVQSDISSIKDTVTEMQEDVTENTSAIEALQSHTSYKKLYDTVTVTAEDIAAAGDEGVTVITVGDENIELSQYTEIIIKTYVPRDATTNSKSGYLAVNLGSTADFDSSLSLIYSYGVSGGGRALVFYPSSTNYNSISTKWAGNDLLTGSITMVAGSVGAPYTSSGLGATQKDILRGAKYIHLFADIDSNTPWKFPAGSYVEVYAR